MLDVADQVVQLAPDVQEIDLAGQVESPDRVVGTIQEEHQMEGNLDHAIVQHITACVCWSAVCASELAYQLSSLADVWLALGELEGAASLTDAVYPLFLCRMQATPELAACTLRRAEIARRLRRIPQARFFVKRAKEYYAFKGGEAGTAVRGGAGVKGREKASGSIWAMRLGVLGRWEAAVEGRRRRGFCGGRKGWWGGE